VSFSHVIYYCPDGHDFIGGENSQISLIFMEDELRFLEKESFADEGSSLFSLSPLSLE
jgi:hypothetical protein